jgi:superfamily I DNA and/or RNA helicase
VCGFAVALVAVNGKESTSEGRGSAGRSFSNEKEAQLAVDVTALLLRENDDLESVAILTPYNGQVIR